MEKKLQLLNQADKAGYRSISRGAGRNIRLTLEYDGSRYNGWQRQIKIKSTVQGRIEHVLALMTGEHIEIHGAGRTDAGVHALGQVANFHTKTRMPLPEMKKHLDQYLPEDINLLDIREVPERFHARLNAVGKVYMYRIWNHPLRNIFLRNYCYHVKKPLNIEAMKQAADLFVGTRDFRSFTAVKSKNKSTVRTIAKIEISEQDHDIRIVFEGDGFLHKMVRILTGTVIQAGTGDLAIADIREMFGWKDRSAAGFTAPSHALFLVRVIY